VINENGHMWGRHRHRTVEAVSVFKAMLLVTYLRMGSVRDRKLRDGDRHLLGPMIKVSNSTAASRVRDIVGHGRITELARDVRMKNFHVVRPWGASQITARDQARFFFKIKKFIPNRHKDYALWLLANVAGHQRWGMADFVDDRMRRWTSYFKGGWGSGTGRWSHQVALLEKNNRRLAIAILTEHSPSHAYANQTMRGVARRLLRSR
jgi:Beta-lactamase enzyme family